MFLIVVSIIIFNLLIYVGAVRKVLFSNMISQERGHWCWASAAQQSGYWWANYNEPLSSRPVSQSEIVRHVKGSVVNLPANNAYEVAKAAKCAAYNHSKAKPVATESYNFSFNTIKGFVDQGKPIICNQYSILNGTGHSLLISGYEDTSSVKNVIYVDPTDGKRYEISYDKFVSGWQYGYLWVWAVYWQHWN